MPGLTLLIQAWALRHITADEPRRAELMGYSRNRPDNLTRQGGHKNPDMSQPHPVNSQITHTTPNMKSWLYIHSATLSQEKWDAGRVKHNAASSKEKTNFISMSQTFCVERKQRFLSFVQIPEVTLGNGSLWPIIIKRQSTRGQSMSMIVLILLRPGLRY